MMTLLFHGLIIFTIIQLSQGSTVRIDINTKQFVDENNRVLLFHGINAVYKLAPWIPMTEGFDANYSLSDIDAMNLANWGFNVVRLGVMWPGVEPGTRGDYNISYLEEVNKIVKYLEKENIYVILDLHQDLFHRKFCGEGVPDYVYESCIASEPEGTKLFPEPAVHGTYPTDENGDPEIESCLSEMFATYYMSAEVGAGFQCLYDNRDNLWEAMGNFWIQVAKYFSSSKNVLGYELLNEPWAGDIYQDPKRLLPGVTEKNYLAPLYQYLHEAIRTVDDEKIIFFEGLTIDYWPNGFDQGPGGAEYNDRQALAYHIYCPIQDWSPTKEVVCEGINAEFFAMRQRDSDRMGVAMLMTEFGAAENIKGDMIALQRTVEHADKYLQSWMYWQFKYYNDITTCTPVGEGMYNADGTVVDAKMNILTRPYPQATAGLLKAFDFDSGAGSLVMTFSPLADVSAASVLGRTTDIYCNGEYHFRFGVTVELSSPAGFTIVPKKNHILLVQNQNITEEEVTVTIKRCVKSDDTSKCYRL